MPGATSERANKATMSMLNTLSKYISMRNFSCIVSFLIVYVGLIVLLWCSSSEWNEIDPSEREDLHLKMEDGEFW